MSYGSSNMNAYASTRDENKPPVKEQTFFSFF